MKNKFGIVCVFQIWKQYAFMLLNINIYALLDVCSFEEKSFLF